LESGILKVINCPCTNAIMHFVGKLTGKYCELANIEIEGNECKVTICVMKSA